MLMTSMRRILLLTAACAVALAAADIPRPEYPRPQFKRADWLSLNGSWQFSFDDGNTGLAAHWEAPTHVFGKTITVPFAFETAKSGIGDPSFHPVLWYRRTFDPPSAWKGRHVLLNFGAVNYLARVWVNGRLAGVHEGGSTPFHFDITGLLTTGENVLTVRAEFPPTDRYIPRGKQFWKEKSESIFYTRTSGIWQTVWLEPVAEAHIESFRITADEKGNASFDARVTALPGVALAVQIEDAVNPPSGTASVKDGRAHVSLSLANPRLWSPDSPSLYTVQLTLNTGGHPVDKVTSYLGFRSVSTENGRVLLNGSPLYLKMVLDQGYWPESNLTPPSDEAIRYDIEMTKKMGFNGARKHQKLEDPRYLYWADKLGLLVSSEMANAYQFDDLAVERFTREWMAAVERDYSHPSIIIWVPINESWGVPDLNDSRQQNYLRELYALTRSLDGSRLVVDNDGWEHTDMTDLFNVHDYTRSGDEIAAKYARLGKPGAGVPDNGKQVLVTGYRCNGTPVVLSEFGGIAFIPPGHVVPKQSWGYSGVEKTADDALTRLRQLYAGIARVPGFAGVCYTQLTDVEQEVNGLMTYDRKPKYPVQRLHEINDMLESVPAH
jgi:beta-galactosidase/beta-glucuronidase